MANLSSAGAEEGIGGSPTRAREMQPSPDPVGEPQSGTKGQCRPAGSRPSSRHLSIKAEDRAFLSQSIATSKPVPANNNPIKINMDAALAERKAKLAQIRAAASKGGEDAAAEGVPGGVRLRNYVPQSDELAASKDARVLRAWDVARRWGAAGANT